MSVETQVPTIPAVTDSNVTAAVRHIKQLLDVREGRAGAFLDANVTFRDLVKSGLAVSPNWASPAYPVAAPGVFSSGYNPATDYTPPPSPEGVVAAGGIGTIILQWNDPGYRNHGYAEVWRSATNVIGDAVLHATSDTRFYTDAIGAGATFYYWVRFVSLGNITGPYQGIAGVLGATGQDPSYLTSLLVGQLSTSQLNTALNARLNLIDGPQSVPGSVAQRVNEEAQARAAGLLAEAQARGTAVDAIQTQINALLAFEAVENEDIRADLLAALQEEQTARITADAAEATSRETLATQMRGSYAGTDITQITSGLIYSERQARSTADGALSTSIAGLSSTVTNNFNTLNAAIQTESTTRASSIASLSTQVTTLQSTVTNNNSTLTAALQTESTTRASIDGGLLAQFTVKTQVNGYISGFGLASTSNNAAPTSEFLVLADTFKIASPSGPGITPAAPFIVRTTPTTIGGVNVPVGVYMQDAFIANGTITNAKIANAAIDNAKIANLDAAKITTGFISADRIDAGTIDAKILNVASAKVTGQLVASQINGANLEVRAGQYTGYAWPTSGGGFYLGPAGILMGRYNAANPASSGYFQFESSTGNIYASGLNIIGGNATFTGQLNVASGASGDRLEITSQVIKVFSGGVLRVKIGNLAA